MANGRDDDVVRAAGAVVWRPGARGPEVALVHRPRYDDWSYPKGKCERGEHVLLGAVREVEEETSLRIVLGRPLRPLVYRSGGRPKRVGYWVARAASSAGFVPGSEVDEVAWLPASAARERLSYQRDVRLLDEFLAGPARTVPFIVLRHATAGRKAASRVADLARPLDAQGTQDAKLLAALLGCFAPTRVVSSAAERCVATVRPFAAAAGVPVELEPAFGPPGGGPAATVPGAATIAEKAVRGAQTGRKGGRASARAGGRASGDQRGDGGAARQLVAFAGSGGTAVLTAEQAERKAAQRAADRAGELAASGVPTVICVHRENLPLLLEAACTALGSRPPQSAPLPKGAFWVLQSAGGVLVSAEQHWLAE